MAAYDFRTVPLIHVGRGATAQLSRICAPLIREAKRIFLVTDAGVRTLGLTDAAVESLQAAGLDVHVFDQVVADPPKDIVLMAEDEARAFGAEIVIGLGGGSSLDTAKLIALLLGSSQTLEEMYGVNNATGP